MSVTGQPGGSPVKAGIPVTDLGAGLFALVGVLAALHHRARTGAGQHVDAALVDAGVGLSVWEATEYFSGQGIPAALGSAHRMRAPYQAIRCADGYITIGAANDRLFRRLCEALGREEWSTLPLFADTPSRVRNHEALASRIESITTPDPQIVARGMAVETDHPVLGRLKTLGSPLKMSATPPDVRRRAPLLGEHTD